MLLTRIMCADWIQYMITQTPRDFSLLRYPSVLYASQSLSLVPALSIPFVLACPVLACITLLYWLIWLTASTDGRLTVTRHLVSYLLSAAPSAKDDSPIMPDMSTVLHLHAEGLCGILYTV